MFCGDAPESDELDISWVARIVEGCCCCCCCWDDELVIDIVDEEEVAGAGKVEVLGDIGGRVDRE